MIVKTDENEEFVTATYRCDDGYHMKGKSEITCDLDDDEWKGQPPQCIEGEFHILLFIGNFSGDKPTR